MRHAVTPLLACIALALAPAGAAQPPPQVTRAVTAIFGPYAAQALRVVGCETGGTYSTRARNGQYLGLFQMGAYARGRYGHATDALGQARAAYRYFVASGRDWSPWECKP